MTEKGRRQRRPSVSKKAKCEGATSIWETSSHEVRGSRQAEARDAPTMAQKLRGALQLLTELL
ncbi:Uncharacterized protein FKW44_011908 [Caligus rogercresseyi]|uniref:Uncharacterized protein n=1 Tax=Caligus rogercresseyi TaxID=217165 RepID=A0A7T8K964_CALRO|nr:Uncharacterized protein FKW44_011908 [Caligus rogercresseyi]